MIAALIAILGLVTASAMGAKLSLARCHSDSGTSDCAAAASETETPEPTATTHRHVNFAGLVWDNAVGTPLPLAEVGITTCTGFRYMATTSATGYYSVWHPTEGEFSCGLVAYDVSADRHATVRESVMRSSDYRDFVLVRLPVSTLYLPLTGIDHAPLR